MPRLTDRGALNNSLEPTWPAWILELRSELALGWPSGVARVSVELTVEGHPA